MTAGGRSALAGAWLLDPAVHYLNHGAFGACPREVLEAQAEWQRRLEAGPTAFMRALEGELDKARVALAGFLGAAPDGLAFVTNATSAVNAVLRSLSFGPGDELLVSDHAYGASRKALEYVAERSGARVVRVALPFIGADPDAIARALLGAATSRTRLALVDHVTSPTALVLPVERIVHELAERGVDTLVDGAHAPGMVPLALDRLGAAYYTGNLHKWVCAPKGAAFLHVRADRRAEVHPLSISHGWHSSRTDRSSYHQEFDWTGTFDPSAWLSVPEALRHVGRLLPGGWPAVRERNRALAVEGRELLCGALGLEPPVAGDMLGSMASIPLPAPRAEGGARDALQAALYARFRVEVPVFPWPQPVGRMVRLSAQLYNDRSDYEALAEGLRVLLAEGL